MQIKKICAVLLALIIAISVGIITTSAAVSHDDTEEVSANEQIIVHARQDGLTQPYIYLWNSLPTNKAMSQSYPGEKMTASGKWFNYTVTGVTKVNALITGADGKQYSKEQKLIAAEGGTQEWWFDNGKWTKYDPDQTDPIDSSDPREDTLYFVMTTRFYNGDTGNDVHCWDDSNANNPDSDPAWRGDFKGLADKLDYIKALGFNAIWVTSVVTNASGYDYHGYHAMDFGTVDYRYESVDFDYQDLIHAVHQKGMKIYQDMMFNDQIHDAAKAAGKPNFLMFGEICTRYTEVWYRGHAEESAPYYTWKESNSKWADSCIGAQRLRTSTQI